MPDFSQGYVIEGDIAKAVQVRIFFSFVLSDTSRYTITERADFDQSTHSALME